MNISKPTLRPFRNTDREIILDILTDEHVKKTYMLPDFENRDAAVPLFLRLKELSEDASHYVRCISIGDSPVGFLNDVEIQGSRIELGYVIHPAFQRRGYMTGALNAAMEELLSKGFHEIITGAFESNGASIRVMEKCGMVRLAETEEITYRGNVHRCIYYTLKP